MTLVMSIPADPSDNPGESEFMSPKTKINNKKSVNPSAGDPSDQASADNILSLIHILSNRISRAFSSEVEPRFKITLAEWRVILSLANNPDASAIDITNRWSMDKMAVNRAIRKLEDTGSIKRTRNPKDRRSLVLKLTAKGRRLYDEIVPAANNRYQDIISVLSRNDLHQLGDKLSRLMQQAETLENRD